ncbi:MAG TPA: hypothetical protein VGI95_18405 [Caulobacteraceae bacterium]|jgi:hypothetical protein
MTPEPHRGIAEDDPRNAGPIAFFRPPDATAAYIHARFAQIYPNDTAAQVEERVSAFMAKLAASPPRPPAPLSQDVQDIADPFHQLSTHPDIVEALWRMDGALPLSSRWVVWGRPALVHPLTGLIFAVAIGSIDIVMRLPPEARDGANAVRQLSLGRTYDVSPAGPEWRFVELRSEPLARLAFDFAGEPQT